MNLPHLQKQSHQMPASPTLGPKSLRALTQPIVGGRKTYSFENQQLSNFEDIAEMPDPTASWRTLQVSRKHLLELPYERLSQMALDLSPMVDKGRFDFLRMGNPGYLLEEAGNDAAVDGAMEFVEKLSGLYGSFKTHINKLWTSIFVFGAIFKELVLNQKATEAEDLAIISPLLARFVRQDVPGRGNVWVLAQYQENQLVRFGNDRLVKYIGFDTDVSNPYGRPMITPAVYASLTLLMLIDILQRVLANQGLSRIDYALDIEQLLILIDRNPDIAGNDEATAQFIEDQITAIQTVLKNLDPEQDYVHTSAVNVNYPSSSIQTNMEGLDVIIKNLQRDVVNGFKSVSTLSNILDSTTETHGTLQIEYFVSAIQSFQTEVAASLKEDLDNANMVRGIRSDLRFQFKRQRTADKRTMAETEKIRTETIIAQMEAGLLLPEEAIDKLNALQDELELV